MTSSALIQNPDTPRNDDRKTKIGMLLNQDPEHAESHKEQFHTKHATGFRSWNRYISYSVLQTSISDNKEGNKILS